MASSLCAASRCTVLRKSSSSGVRSAVVRARVVRCAASAADRPLWYPGNPPPAHLNGT